MTVKECGEIIAKLKAENDPKNDKLIAYYTKVIDQAYRDAAIKVLNRAFGAKH